MFKTSLKFSFTCNMRAPTHCNTSTVKLFESTECVCLCLHCDRLFFFPPFLYELQSKRYFSYKSELALCAFASICAVLDQTWICSRICIDSICNRAEHSLRVQSEHTSRITPIITWQFWTHFFFFLLWFSVLQTHLLTIQIAMRLHSQWI